MVFDHLYRSNSAGDPGILIQVKDKLNRKKKNNNNNNNNVDEKVNKPYHGCEAFFSTVLHGYVVCAAIEYFGMTSPDGTPSKYLPDPGGLSPVW